MNKKRRIILHIDEHQYDALVKAAAQDDREIHTWMVRRLFREDSTPAVVTAPAKPDIFSRAKNKVAMQGFDDPPEEP